MLTSATIYHIDQSIKLLLPQVYVGYTVHQVIYRTKVYNWCTCGLVISYLGLFLFIFFDWYDIEVVWVLGINLAMRVIMLTIYCLTVLALFRKLRYFGQD